MAQKNEIRQMFNSIAPRYDRVNNLISVHIDKLWRRKVCQRLEIYKPDVILDVATGTACMAIELLKVNPKKIIGIDIAETMLEVGRKKVLNLQKQDTIFLQLADCEKMPFDDDSFDAVTVSFGVRNFENLQLGLAEIYRVLKSGGVLLILEFGKPSRFPVNYAYLFYFNYLVPLLGKLVSGNYRAYKYLPDSVNTFPFGQNFIDILIRSGFKNCRSESISFGISYLYEAFK